MTSRHQQNLQTGRNERPVDPLIEFTVPGKPRGSERARSKGRLRFHSPEHLAARDAIVAAVFEARIAGAGWPDAEMPVRVVIESWHHRPLRLSKARRWHGDGRRPYLGKPDADNIAKLVLDAMTLAGVWIDDTVVAQLEVRRWWVPVEADGTQGEEGLTVRVEAL